MSRRPTDQARDALVNITVIASELPAALRAIDEALSGWPEQTPGAAPPEPGPARPCTDDDCTNVRPCPVHDRDDMVDPVKLTGPERGAELGDKARRDLEQLRASLRRLDSHAVLAAGIVHRWAHGGLAASTVVERLVAADALIWCSHCAKFGRHEPREQGRQGGKPRTLCAFCRSFQVDWKVLPSREIWDARDARGGRLDVATIERILRGDGRTDGSTVAERERDARRAKLVTG